MKFIDVRNTALVITILFLSAIVTVEGQVADFDLIAIGKTRVLKKAERYLNETPRTVTADFCQRSVGGSHDFYSEGDY